MIMIISCSIENTQVPQKIGRPLHFTQNLQQCASVVNFHLPFIIDQRSENIVLTVGRCLSQVSESCGMLRRCHCEENLRPGPGSQPCAVRYRQLARPHGSVLSLKHKILNTKFSGGPRSQSKPLAQLCLTAGTSFFTLIPFIITRQTSVILFGQQRKLILQVCLRKYIVALRNS